ncbi:YihY/virulence factor BrkB family protein [Microbacterium sp. bgisy189]|uniref:YihY/virulence factor BrkB family protein n=1 Tax=Microbacterium sp. bgisy189 TaxID=3413798 RepID=UPI003EC07770
MVAWMLRRSLVRAYFRYSMNKGPMLADSVTYRTLFSVFAGVLLGFSIAAIWLTGNPTAWQALVAAVDSAVPGLVGDDGLIDTSEIAPMAGLTIAGAVSLLGLIGAAIGAIGSLRLAMRQIAGIVGDDTLFIWVLLRNLLLAVTVGAGLLASAGATMLGTAGLDLVAGWLGVAGDDPLVTVAGRALAIVVTFVLDAVIIAALFRVLSGVRAKPKALWSGALVGAVGLTVLQQLSGLFVGGATSNPLLATFGSLIALLLWLNLSAQVILIATAFIVTKVAEDADRVRETHGSTTIAQLRVHRAEDAVVAASAELRTAQAAARSERGDA